MTFIRRTAFAFLGCALTGLSALPAFAAGSVIQVGLWDRGNMPMMGEPQMAMGMMGADMPMAMMGVTLDQAKVPSGDITFQVTNNSTDMIHEMVLAAVDDVSTQLPYIREEQRVDEDAAGDLGEVAALESGQSGALTLTLKPGTYILYCNIPGHYMARMWTLLTVTG